MSAEDPSRSQPNSNQEKRPMSEAINITDSTPQPLSVVYGCGDKSFAGQDVGQACGAHGSVIRTTLVPSGSPNPLDKRFPVTIVLSPGDSSRPYTIDRMRFAAKHVRHAKDARAARTISFSGLHRKPSQNSESRGCNDEPDEHDHGPKGPQAISIRILPGYDGQYISDRINDVADALARGELPLPEWASLYDEWPEMHGWEEAARQHCAETEMDRVLRSEAIATCRRQWIVRPEKREELVHTLAGAVHEAGGGLGPLMHVLSDLNREAKHFSSEEDLKATATASWTLATGISEDMDDQTP